MRICRCLPSHCSSKSVSYLRYRYSSKYVRHSISEMKFLCWLGGAEWSQGGNWSWQRLKLIQSDREGYAIMSRIEDGKSTNAEFKLVEEVVNDHEPKQDLDRDESLLSNTTSTWFQTLIRVPVCCSYMVLRKDVREMNGDCPPKTDAGLKPGESTPLATGELNHRWRSHRDLRVCPCVCACEHTWQKILPEWAAARQTEEWEVLFSVRGMQQWRAPVTVESIFIWSPRQAFYKVSSFSAVSLALFYNYTFVFSHTLYSRLVDSQLWYFVLCKSVKPASAKVVRCHLNPPVTLWLNDSAAIPHSVSGCTLPWLLLFVSSKCFFILSHFLWGRIMIRLYNQLKYHAWHQKCEQCFPLPPKCLNVFRENAKPHWMC